MKKILVSIGATLLAGAGAAQSDSVLVVKDDPDPSTDSTTYEPDSVQGIAFTRHQLDEIEYASHAAAREREERAAARVSASTNATARTTSSSRSNAKSLHGGAKLSLDRATDKQGRKHWGRMNRRSTRRAPDSPPGTVPVY